MSDMTVNIPDGELLVAPLHVGLFSGRHVGKTSYHDIRTFRIVAHDATAANPFWKRRLI
jgi:hypothetical protein